MHDIIVDAARVPGDREREQLRRTASHPRCRRSSLLTCPDLVHLYMTRRSWPRRWRGCACAAWRRTGTHRPQPPTAHDTDSRTDREVTTRGDDSRGQGRTEPAGGQFGQRPPRRGGLAAAVRRRTAHRVGPGRRRGRGRPRASSRAGCARTSTTCTATTRSCMCCPPAASARAPAMSCGSPRTVRRWPARPGCSICAAGRCAGCPPRWSAAASATPKPLGVARFWRTAR